MAARWQSGIGREGLGHPGSLAAGEEGGGAVADVLFGMPNGRKLSISFPRHVGQVPVFYNQKPSGASRTGMEYVSVQAGPLYPFGHA